MGKFNDLTGKRFGDLTAAKATSKRTSNGTVVWSCICSCGSALDASRTSLISGDSVSCGCKKHDRALQNIKNFHNTNCVEGTHLRQINTQKPQSNNKSGVRGVWWDGRAGKWVAELKVKGTKHHLGRFSDLKDAAKARAQAEEKYFKPIIERHKDRLIP